MPGRRLKVLLVNPSWDGLVSRKGRRFNRAWAPLDLLNCAAILEQDGLNVSLIDARAEPTSSHTIREAAAQHDLVFVTSSPIDRWQCPNLDLDPFLAVTSLVEPRKLHVMGAHGTVVPDELLSMTQARAVIRGEPEPAVRALCRGMDPSEVPGVTHQSDGTIRHNPEGPALDLTSLPMPAFRLLDLRHYRYEILGDRFVLLETTRGCHYRCHFCLLKMYGKGYRRKDPDQVIREVTYLVRDVGARTGYFIDLEFTAARDYVWTVCERLTAAGLPFEWACQTRADYVDEPLLNLMKRAGCRLIHFGVESGSPRVLAATNKRITLEQIERGITETKQAGIDQVCFFMFGFPGETAEDMEATIAFAKRLNPTYASFHAVTPYLGTKLYEMSGSPELFPEVLSKEHDPLLLQAIADRAFREFYLRPAVAWSRLRRANLRHWRRQAALFWYYVRPAFT
ncbi:MAG: radical SAM protein [Candidatus Methylomirabilis oxyfera]|nr:radical SAM protein [Candidatus Methylomirabilis oxyfera]